MEEQMLNSEQPVQSTFSKALLTSVFVGIIATLACLAFNIWFRGYTEFQLSTLINVSSLIFSVNIIFVLIGVAYYGCIRASRKGDIIFEAILLTGMILCIWKAGAIDRTDNLQLNMEFRNLLKGVILIMSIAALSIPLLFHNKNFEKHII